MKSQSTQHQDHKHLDHKHQVVTGTQSSINTGGFPMALTPSQKIMHDVEVLSCAEKTKTGLIISLFNCAGDLYATHPKLSFLAAVAGVFVVGGLGVVGVFGAPLVVETSLASTLVGGGLGGGLGVGVNHLARWCMFGSPRPSELKVRPSELKENLLPAPGKNPLEAPPLTPGPSEFVRAAIAAAPIPARKKSSRAKRVAYIQGYSVDTRRSEESVLSNESIISIPLTPKPGQP